MKKMGNENKKRNMPDKKAVLKFLMNYGVITLGCVIYSFGVALFLDASNLASGGVTGIAIVINYALETWANYNLDTGIIIIIINIPLFILGAVFFGHKFIISTIYSTVLSSLMMWGWSTLFDAYLPFFDSLLLSGIVGGVLFGLGLGLIFRMGSSTGGTDIIVKILRKKFRYIRTGMISMIIDIAIVAVSALVYRDLELACYTAISIVIFSTTFDWILYGGNSAKLVYIITTDEKAKLICEKLLKELDVGATYLDGEGAYTGEQKRVIMCATKNFLYPRMRDAVRSVDPDAFMIVSSAKEIYGEGYKNHFDDEL